MKKEFTRREVFGVGLGAAALAASGSVIAAAQPGKHSSQGITNKSSKLNKFKEYGDELETCLRPGGWIQNKNCFEMGLDTPIFASQDPN